MKPALAILILFVLSFTQSATLEAQSKLDDLKARKAKTAVNSYKKVVEEAREDYEKEVARSRDHLIEILQGELKSETSDGNFEEAIKIKSALEQLENEAKNGAAKNKTQQIMGGVWKVQFSNGLVRYQSFTTKNGHPYTLRTVEINGKIDDEGPVVVREGKILVSYKVFAHLVERYTIDGDRMIVEHWDLNSGNTIDRFPNLFAIATRVVDETK